MKKLIIIPEHLIPDLLVITAIESKGNLNAQIVKLISKAVEAHKGSSSLK
jgi:hypothetical protein